MINCETDLSILIDVNVKKIIDDRLTIRIDKKNEKGEVFTPLKLIFEILDKIPNHVWYNPNLKWLDPANGIGNFPIIIYYKLMDCLKDIYIPSNFNGKSLSKHIIEDMLYMVELSLENYVTSKSIFNIIDPDSKPNIYNGSFIDDDDDDEDFENVINFNINFDIIVGNPPFQYRKKENIKSKVIWDLFIIKSMELLNDDGFLVFINPQGWREYNNRFKEVTNYMKDYNLIYLNMNSYKQKEFNIATAYDYYVLQKNKEYNNTIINDIDNKEYKLNLKLWDLFIPNGEFKLFNNIIEKDCKKRLNLLHSWNKYETRNSNSKNPTSKIKSEEFKYPIVYTTVKKGKKINCIYSNIKEVNHFVPKVIWSNGVGSHPIVDNDGKYGLTQFAYGIIDNVNNLEYIKKAMDSEKFLNLMNYVKYTNNKYNYKIIGLFKKNFYKYF
jgi:hypothetical protein